MSVTMKTPPNTFSLRFEDSGIAWLSIDVPGEKMNTLRASFVDEINAILTELEAKADLQGLVIYSAKPDNFIAGADVHMIDACQCKEEATAISEQGQRLFSRIEQLPFHVVAAIHGPCLGGGLELALACHSRIVTDDDKTRLGLPEVQLGLLPGSGGTQRLPRLIGLVNALDLILTGKQVRAKKAQKLGLVDDVVSHSIFLAVAQQRALTPKPKRHLGWQDWMMTGNPLGRAVVFASATKKTNQKTRGNYPAIAAILEVINDGLENGIEEGLTLEATRFGELVMTPESAALRRLFFSTTLMKKETGVNATPSPVNGVVVLGGGLMGAGIAHVTATNASLPVRIKDLSNDGLLHALHYNFTLLKKKHQRHVISKAQLQAQMSRISVTTSHSGMSHCNVVIEAVFEDLLLKHKMVAQIEQALGEKTIFATNTSSLPIHQIAKGAKRPENIVGLHYFSPVEKMPLVEVIPHSGTSAQTVATVVNLAKKQGKMPIVVADKAGFYVNRILTPYMSEAALILLGGESIEHIDASLVDFGFPLGPVSLLDEVGIDVAAKISPILRMELGDRFRVPDLFDVMLKTGRKGRKTGKGFFVYKGKHKKVDKRVYGLLKIKRKAQLSGYDLALRCVLLMLNEAARCVDEGVVKSARDGDIGAVFGIGFPPFLGGPFCYMDHLGITNVVALLEEHQAKYGERFAPCRCLKEMAADNRTFLT